MSDDRTTPKASDADREEVDADKAYLSEREEMEVTEHRSLSAVSVYTIVHAEGIEELERPVMSLWWSGVAAGLGISASVLCEGILHHIFEGHPRLAAIENLGYTVGFILVILARLQLFTENTITPILPLLAERTSKMAWCTARLWGVVFAANMAGTFVTALLSLVIGTSNPDHIEAMLAISHHYYEFTPGDAFARGIPAGFFIAALVWMLPSSRGFEIFTIALFTYIIALGDFTHVIAGSTELFMLILSGEAGIGKSAALTLATLAGNVLGGTGLFALLAYGQVVSEIGDTTRGERGDARDRETARAKKAAT